MTHSTFFHFTKSPRYFAAVDEVREPHAEPQRPAAMTWEEHKANGAPNRWSEQVRGPLGAGDFTSNPLGKLPGSVWHLTYPQAVERIIKGWAPTGICRACGEPRRPVVDNQTALGAPTTGDKWSAGDIGPDNGRHRRTVRGSTEATITGYACLCPEPTAETDAPEIILAGAS